MKLEQLAELIKLESNTLSGYLESKKRKLAQIAHDEALVFLSVCEQRDSDNKLLYSNDRRREAATLDELFGSSTHNQLLVDLRALQFLIDSVGNLLAYHKRVFNIYYNELTAVVVDLPTMEASSYESPTVTGS